MVVCMKVVVGLVMDPCRLRGVAWVMDPRMQEVVVSAMDPCMLGPNLLVLSALSGSGPGWVDTV